MKSWTLRALAFAAIVGLVFAVVEGMSSAAIFGYEAIFAGRYLAERSHSKYDSLLGWVNIASFHVPDLYGPGKYLRTNSRGFRSDHETEVSIPEGKYRIICSGDSFTLGWGVANDQTWCHDLTELDDRLDAVNMGQGGYGIDQAYLWYMRDGRVLDHTIHLFAFITTDFTRMSSSSFFGYGKPVLRLQGDSLITENVPVPRVHYRFPWVNQIGKAAQGLRSVQLAQRAIEQLVPQENVGANDVQQATRDVVKQIFLSLQRANDAKNSVLVLVYLAEKRDASDTNSDAWRELVRTTADSAGIAFIDLVVAIREEPPNVVDALFIPRDGHYSEQGHEWVAENIYAGLRELPELDSVLPRR